MSGGGASGELFTPAELFAGSAAGSANSAAARTSAPAVPDAGKPLKSEIVVYTDGGCSGNPGAGGWACVIIDEEAAKLGIAPKDECFSGGEKLTTNNRMELSAVICALSQIIKKPYNSSRPVCVFTDSQYVKNGISTWINGWKRKGWKTASGGAVKNQDLWQQLDQLNGSLNVEWRWVKGHAGIKYNEICDSLCQKEIAKYR